MSRLRVEFQPIGINVQAERLSSLLEAAQSAGIGLSAVCGGKSTCGSCLVRISNQGAVSPLNEIEKKTLSSEQIDKRFRLACQVQVWDDVVVDIPAESLSAPQRTQIEGYDRPISIDPSTQVIEITIPDQPSPDVSGCWERFCQLLNQQGISSPQAPEIQVLRRLPDYLNTGQEQKRVVLKDRQVVGIFPPETAVLGMAIDIGTTKIAGYLANLENGETLSAIGMMNPQIAYGEDVMARISCILKEKQCSSQLQQIMVEAINRLAGDLCTEASLDCQPGHIVEVLVVGNTAMHHILLGLPVKQLGTAPYQPAIASSLDLNASDWGLEISPGGRLCLLPNIAGFVGADHVSMLLATGISTEKKCTLYIDIGTNTEITLLAGKRAIACSTASGPAFEGAHIKNGMRAADGAIERVKIEQNGVWLQTVNNAKAVGICGSGIIDALAQMLHAGIMDKQGMLNGDHPLVASRSEFVLLQKEKTGVQHDIVLTRKDISEIQLAKAAIQAAIRLLLQEAGLKLDDLEQVIIAGAFGCYIDIESAKRIGLLPDLPLDRFTQVGNAAGIGAKRALLSSRMRAETESIGQWIEYLELATHPQFSHQFTNALSFLLFQEVHND